MNVYPTEKIRNVAIIAHGGAGKTSLTEAMLYQTGAIKRLGRVDDGNTTADFYPEEIKRKITINTTLVPCEYRGLKINVLDTPGFADFAGEVKGALRVADSVIVVLSAVAGVEVQTEIYWEECGDLPRIAFINKMDRENASFEKALEEMREKFSQPIVPLQIPIGAEANFKGVVDLIKMRALLFEPGTGKMTEAEIPAELADQVEAYKEQIVEAAAEGDDELLNKYLEGEELTDEEIQRGIKGAATNGTAVFVFCGSALNNMGIQPMMDFIVDCMPDPSHHSDVKGKDVSAEPLAALVFKTIADPYIGRLNFFRVFTGTMKADSVVYNANKEKEERIGNLLVMRGKEQFAVPELKAGDIAAVAKLSVTTTGDTLTDKARPVILKGIEFPQPTLAMAIEPKSKGDEDKLSSALQRLMEEDPTITMEKNTETRQTILKTMGETHTDIIVERLKSKFGVDVGTTEMKIPYRETIRAMVQVEGKHKKQTGGHGQYGHVWLKLEPLPDAEFAFEESVFGGAVPRNFFPAVEKGVREAMTEGVLAGYPVTNVKVTLYDGSYHPVDSSEMSFKLAAILAFRKGMEQAKPVLLEPIMNVEVLIPEQYLGDIIGDLNSKRGRVLGMEPQGKNQLVKAQVPLAEMARYSIDLKSITQGRGKFQMSFSHYEEVPANIAEKIAKK
ncbi:MAG TPA: elongation factor G [Syntrophothermus lipocalidus]|uniref:Elongation factor G n=1 Tax=Syntrophothermus lipocalidus (strain DSM 12680 / TGB-C1) TaxID=643648 RepID=D7CMP4_SYNLT|nr:MULTISPECIES: elongation factor G [Syntrophothermus]ADI01979.1 translation elongation factor G [Syntrophothermus lipocalidus DSM 12680]NSW83859.1 elongation factor G [Syntrophothermus sp.]HHV76713.1 elongation factor G [Syntrophothermus lipocalidus]